MSKSIEKEGAVNAETFSEHLDKSLYALKKGSVKNIALVGRRYSGKGKELSKFYSGLNDTEIAKCWIDLEKIPLTPEDFSVSFIAKVCNDFLGKALGECATIDDISSLDLPENSMKSVLLIKNELLKIKPGQKKMVETALSFPSVLSDELGKKGVVFIKEFYELESLNNFSGVAFEDVFLSLKGGNVLFVATSSFPSLSKDMLKRLGFDVNVSLPFDEKKTKEFVKSKGIVYEPIFYSLTEGDVGFLSALCSRMKTEKNVKKAFVLEALTGEGAIGRECKFILHDALSRARGQTLLKSVIRVLSFYGELRLSEIARLIYRSSPVTKSLLERLMKVDLIEKSGNKYGISGKAMKFWLKKRYFESGELDLSKEAERLEESYGQ